MTKNHIDPLLSSTEVCAELGIKRSTLSHWIDSGRITPTQQLPGKTGAYLFTKAAVERARVSA